MKVALVHDWLIHMRGGEKVLEAIAELFPEATVYTLFCRRRKLSPTLQRMKIKTSFLQWMPGIFHYYRWLLPFLPSAIRTLDLEDADLVISSSHCVAKGVRLPEKATHLCYCHTPMRYAWGFEELYFRGCPFFLRPFLHGILHILRRFDLESNAHVHHFIANSKNVQERIRRFYGRDAAVIYPPLESDFFHPDGVPGDYYLVVSAFVPYKRVDLVIQAFNKLDRKLMIVGTGPLARRYQHLRHNPQISFLGDVPASQLRSLYSRARALVFPTEEDFGIVPLEAQACGTPVIAYGKGGALESVRKGIFFQEQTAEAIRQAVLRFEDERFDRGEIPALVDPFSREAFQKQIKEFVDSCVKQGLVHAAP